MEENLGEDGEVHLLELGEPKCTGGGVIVLLVFGDLMRIYVGP